MLLFYKLYKDFYNFFFKTKLYEIPLRKSMMLLLAYPFTSVWMRSVISLCFLTNETSIPFEELTGYTISKAPIVDCSKSIITLCAFRFCICVKNSILVLLLLFGSKPYPPTICLPWVSPWGGTVKKSMNKFSLFCKKLKHTPNWKLTDFTSI